MGYIYISVYIHTHTQVIHIYMLTCAEAARHTRGAAEEVGRLARLEGAGELLPRILDGVAVWVLAVEVVSSRLEGFNFHNLLASLLQTYKY